jgi:hypothetical protein
MGVAGATGPAGPIGTTGATGAVGPIGPTGTTGEQGPAGPTGATGVQGQSFIFIGTWNFATNYGLGQTVFFQGSTYISLVNGNAGHQPDTDVMNDSGHWALMAQKGATGAAGATGAVGPQGSAGPIGATGVAGPQGAVGPAGATGATGAVGANGAAGPQGPTGATGTTGPQGQSITFVGTWNQITTYATGQTVFFQGASYISLVNNNLNHQPDTDVTNHIGNWALISQQGATGATGAIGATGVQGPQGIQGLTGPTGSTGATGAAGAVGPQGPPVSFQGVWSIATTYAIGGAVSFSGSSYISLVAANLNNQPSTSPADWAVLAQQGSTGATGTTGATGPAGPVGAAGPAGSTGASGATGPQGPPVNFIGAWSAATTYASGGSVSFQGSSYISLVAANLKPHAEHLAYTVGRSCTARFDGCHGRSGRHWRSWSSRCNRCDRRGRSHGSARPTG